MTPEPPAVTELRPLLDALCDETATPDQLRRLEELVVANPEAEAEYVRFMAFYADLLGHVAGLPRPAAPPAPTLPEDAPVSAEPTAPATPEPPHARRSRSRWWVAAAVLLAAGGAVAYPLVGRASLAREQRDRQAALETARAEFARLQADTDAAARNTRQAIDQATAAEQEAVRQRQAALDAARAAAAAKDFTVRLTGPTRVQPGAPNRWQIETLRRGAVARLRSMELVVKDDRDAELLRQTHDHPVGAASLELPVGFWEKVRPGAELFLEVSTVADGGRASLTDRVPLARSAYVTHLATDKPLYQPGETVRFRSLTLDRATLKPPAHDLHLVFRVRDPADAAAPAAVGNGRLRIGSQPVVGPDGRPVRGLGVGEYALAADAPGGEYKLDVVERDPTANTEVLLETRKFVVNRYVPDVFEKKLEFDGKSYGAGDTVRARLDVSRTTGGPMTDARAGAVASVDGRPFFEKPAERLAAITDGGATRTVLDLQFKLPADLFEKAKPGGPPAVTLSVTVRDAADSEAIVRPVPLVTKTLQVGFFPEGGELVTGVPGRVYVQVRTAAGKPADLKGFITDGADRLTDVATLTDAELPGVNRGDALFGLTPKPNTRYFLKVTSPAGIVPPTPDGFPLPEVKRDGVGLTALDAVTGRGDPVRVRVVSPAGPRVLHVGAYARGTLIGQQRVEVDAHRPVELSLGAGAAAGGVTRVTVFEEADGGRLLPRAERLVYRRPTDELKLGVTADRPRYTPGGKVRLDLTAADESGVAAGAVLMVGVVNRSVVTMADATTDRLPPTHFLLAGDVRDPAGLEHADFLLTDHPKAAVALDLLLGAQGWRRFVEQTGSPPDPADRVPADRLLTADGRCPAPPLELVRLEEQRVNAEFAPRLDQARLARAEAEAAATVNPAGGLAAKVAAARSVVSAAVTAEHTAADALASNTELLTWWATVVGLVSLGSLAVIGLYLLAGRFLTDQSARVAVVTGSVALAVMVLAFLSVIGGSKVDSTLSSVGSAPRPPVDRMNAPMAGRSEATAARVFREAAGRQGMDDRNVEAKLTDDPIGVPVASNSDPFAFAPPGMHALPRPKSAPAPMRKPAPVANRVAASRTSDRVNASKPSAGKRPAMAGEPEPVLLPDVLPFAVREYAHQRDPALGDARADFAETVYWHPALVLPNSGRATVEFQLSDDVARYQVVVAGHTPTGRVGALTTTIEARQPVTVEPKLPAEIAHTDVIDLPVRVTNDTDGPRSVAFAVTPRGLTAEGGTSGRLDLGPNGKGRQIVRLRAGMLEGDAAVSAEATSGLDRDAVRRTLRVVPDGFPGVGSFSDTMEGTARGAIALPRDVVPGSLKVRLELYPTSMADLQKGLEGLLREPYGCFEQTSTSNYPNTLILDYLNKSNQASPEVARKARGFLERGYGRLTSFECPDTPSGGRRGFEWFGAADRQHEALTAFGLLQFKDMARVHPVDPELILRTQTFLLSRRDGQDGFTQNPKGYHSWGAPPLVGNAYILWALVESDPDDAERHDLARELAHLKAQTADESAAGGKDPYVLALAANVFLLRGDREAAHRLLDRIQEKHTRDGAVIGAATSVVRSGGRDLQIETTGLALLGWLRANDPRYASAVKSATQWVSRQRGGYGAFGSTQATVLALKALALHAEKSARPAEAGTVRVLVGGREVASRRFTPADVEVIGLDVPNPDAVFPSGQRTDVEVVTDARQAYPFALGYTYTTLTPASGEKCAVAVGTKLGRATAAEGETVPLTVTLENRRDAGQGMAVAVVGLPAGLRVLADLKQLTALREAGRVSFFEVRGRELVLYWRSLDPKQSIELTADLVADVPGTYRGPASRAYLYYDADEKHWAPPLAVTITPAGE